MTAPPRPEFPSADVCGGRLACPRMRRRGLLAHPRDYLAEGGSWPQGPLIADAPPEALLAQAVARRLRDIKEHTDESIRSIARTADISPQAVLNILNGATWGDLPTIARLETTLDTTLWGREHRKGY